MPATREQALAALKRVQSLNPAQINLRISAEIGDPMLGAFSALAKGLHPDLEVAPQVHLMVLAYLLRGEVEGAITS